MKPFHAFMPSAIIALYLCLAATCYAHGDHHPAAEPAPAQDENIYSTPASSQEDLPDLDIIPEEHKDHKAMTGGHDEHAGHAMPQVKITTHEWVSTSQKGYGVAAGITGFAGLLFFALSFIRPNE